MNLVEQYLAEAAADHHDEAVGHVSKIVNHNDVRDFHTDKAKKTGAAQVSKAHMQKAHETLTSHGYSHTEKKDNVHVYKKGGTTVTAYHGDGDINVHTKK